MSLSSSSSSSSNDAKSPGPSTRHRAHTHTHTQAQAQTQGQVQSPVQTQGSWSASAPQRTKTQSEQDSEDEKARQKALSDLIKSWMDRMQLISMITTFFAATESQLLSVTTPSDDPNSTSGAMKAANATLSGALVLHSFSAVVAFLGAFVLVRYKLHEAKREERKVDSHPQARDGSQSEKGPAPARDEVGGGGPWSANPHLVTVGPSSYFRRSSPPPYQYQYPSSSSPSSSGHSGPDSSGDPAPPAYLIERTHILAVLTALGGFILAVTGIICYAFAQQARVVGVFAGGCLGGCLVLAGVVVGGVCGGR
ncbi:hypothetical protein SISNIDRAFT_321043 [Sistotremastrum niveocremeum HHB9708]|uniref:Uncharacterized protein n=1 Tax=Sistotremastrum niveocremeum HHB9708 TaxID=1314777 RepID=A0A164MZV1_9AGAM|nr:hypothetical protein SISNIDRAFT_321043 [Sistotremastrum niveocremeum HHB9708]